MAVLNINFVIACVLFIAFSIGLNLSLHGVISISGHVPTKRKAQGENSESPLSLSSPTVSPTSKQVMDATSKPSSLPIQKESSTTTDQSVAPVNIFAKIDLIHDAVKNMKYEELQSQSDLSSFWKSGGSIPIVLLTCNRVALLEKTLESLLKVRGVKKEQIVVIQDGAMDEIAQLVNRNGIKLIQNKEGIRLRGGAAVDGAERIAKHYKFSLSAAFDASPNAPAIIIVEDDLLFSPDFYEYFMSVGSILDYDDTTFVVSAWNDNGFKDKVKDPFSLRRTDYFPGLGWLLTRKLYKGELEQKWPHSHWDHWLRSVEINHNREIVYPEIPRTYHNGIKGTFMNLETHNKYFRDIDYNTDETLSWISSSSSLDSSKSLAYRSHYPDNSNSNNSGGIYMQASLSYYENRVIEMIKQCKHLNSVQELVNYKDEILCLWINVNPVSEYNPPEFEPISSFFGIWHEHRRGSHYGLHEFYWNNNYILLLNVYDTSRHDASVEQYLRRQHNSDSNKDKLYKIGNYRNYMPSTSKLLDPRSFDKRIALDVQRKNVKLEIFKGDKPGISCDEVCKNVQKKCNERSLHLINSCSIVTNYFSCQDCEKSMGQEQPAYVDLQASAQFHPGHCLINTNPEYSTCSASHPSTIRLCTCD